MGSVRNNLNAGESIVDEAKLHWKIFLLPLAILLFAGYLYSQEWVYLSYLVGIIGLIALTPRLWRYVEGEYIVTNQRAIQKKGILGYDAIRIPLEDITSVKVHCSALGEMLGYGTVICSVDSAKEEFTEISSPEKFRSAIERARQQLRNPTAASEKSLSGDIQPIKAKPVISTELERIQNECKFYSPAQKSYKAAPLPKVGEDWKLERTLPSGLHKVETQNTYSISWHPTKLLIITCGWISNLKLWNIETGELITKEPAWSSDSYGNTISWSYDGEVFVNDRRLFDGETGDIFIKSAGNSVLFFLSTFFSNLNGSATYLPGTGKGSYSVDRYEHLRGFLHGRISNHDSLCASHLSSSSNFSPWRPNSNQYIIDDATFKEWYEEKFNPWKHHSDKSSLRYRKALVFRNRRTGEIEKAIDCAVDSQIEDFAWHPSGRFIAVAFKEHKIRIIDIDEAMIVADLSVQYLVGWSLDGKTLIARKEKYKDEFVIWDAIETKEKPMPEEMRNELWFKRFFKNISADGLRYLKVEGGKGNIYSLASDELVAALPQEVTSAAWSPIDGGLLATCGGSETHIWRI